MRSMTEGEDAPPFASPPPPTGYAGLRRRWRHLPLAGEDQPFYGACRSSSSPGSVNSTGVAV